MSSGTEREEEITASASSIPTANEAGETEQEMKTHFFIWVEVLFFFTTDSLLLCSLFYFKGGSSTTCIKTSVN